MWHYSVGLEVGSTGGYFIRTMCGKMLHAHPGMRAEDNEWITRPEWMTPETIDLVCEDCRRAAGQEGKDGSSDTR